MEKGLLVDTGASINAHCVAWRKSFRDQKLKPSGLWLERFSSQSNITGVEGNPMGPNQGFLIPSLEFLISSNGCFSLGFSRFLMRDHVTIRWRHDRGAQNH